MARTVNKEQAAKRRQQILDAALDCFGKKGFHQTTMQEVCKKARLSPGTVYHYFKSKDEIIEHIADREVEKAEHFSRHILQAPSLLEGLDTVIDYILKDSRADTGFQIYIEVLCEAGRNHSVRKKILKSEEIALKAIRQVLDRERLKPADVSQNVLADFLGAQLELLELYKRYEPPAKQCAQMADISKRTLHLLVKSIKEGQ